MFINGGASGIRTHVSRGQRNTSTIIVCIYILVYEVQTKSTRENLIC